MKKIVIMLFVLFFAKGIVYADYSGSIMGTINFAVETQFLSDEKKQGFTPLRLALVQDLALPWYVKTVGGIDLGILSTRAKTVYGIQTAVITATADNITGIQLGLGYVIAAEKANAIQIGGIGYAFGDFNGLQFGMLLAGTEGRLKGWQFGMNAVTYEESYGLQTGVFGASADGFNGVQLAGIFALGSVKGIGISPVRIMGTNQSENLKGGGINISVFNYGYRSEEKYNFTGLMLSGFNVGNAEIKGLQAGIYNSASEVKGVQIGVINYASSLSGLQIGAINIAKNAAIPVLPVINFKF